jgi:hypothetical protein
MFWFIISNIANIQSVRDHRQSYTPGLWPNKSLTGLSVSQSNVNFF